MEQIMLPGERMMSDKSRTALKVCTLSFLSLFLLTTTAGASPITIIGYDISNALASGLGNWHHTYTGSIVPTGTVSTPAGPATVADYTGGSGTLTDGLFDGPANDHLLFTNDSAGAPINTTITLYLSDLATIDDIVMFGGNSNNPVHPNLTGMTVDINGTSAALVGTPIGPDFGSGPVDDLFIIAGTSLALATNKIVISAITASGAFSNSYSITEIQVDGSPVPEPASVILLGTGLIGAGVRRYRRRA